MKGAADRKQWFTQSIEVNLDALYGAAMRLTRSRADAEDLVAETVTRAWSALDSLKDRSRFRPWIFRILNNCFLSVCRKKSSRPQELSWVDSDTEGMGADITSLLLDQPDAFLDFWANPEEQFYNNLLGKQIRDAIAQLPPAFRITVLLINVDGLGYDEAAEVLGVPSGTIRSRMKRGRTLLQKALWRQARDAGLEAQTRDRRDD